MLKITHRIMWEFLQVRGIIQQRRIRNKEEQFMVTSPKKSWRPPPSEFNIFFANTKSNIEKATGANQLESYQTICLCKFVMKESDTYKLS